MFPRSETGKLTRPMGVFQRLRFLIKCDDDAFLDIDAVAADLIASAPVGGPE